MANPTKIFLFFIFFIYCKILGAKKTQTLEPLYTNNISPFFTHSLVSSYIYSNQTNLTTFLLGTLLTMSWLLPCLVLVLLIFQEPLCTCTSISDLFETWCQQHGKKYSSEQERVYRFKVFEENYAYIIEHNSKGNSSYTLGLNEYSDLTHHEFRETFLGLSSSANDFIRLKHGGLGSGTEAWSDVGDVDIPSSLDWREKGAVTNVKNQGSCGMLNLFVLFLISEMYLT